MRLASRARWQIAFDQIGRWQAVEPLDKAEKQKDKELEWEHDVSSILRDDAVVDAVEEDETEEQTPPVDEPSLSTGFDIKAVDGRGGGHVER